MPKISRYGQDQAVTGGDKLLGQDSSGATRTYTIASVSTFIQGEISAGATYKHTQSTLATQWTVNHNLNIADALPHITIKSDSGTYNNYEILGDIRYVNANRFTINFHTEQRGFAFVG
tara:strand:+ start:509 stop:862 length:354 start_codon:yes stop_codon:yes gene_type:complete